MRLPLLQGAPVNLAKIAFSSGWLMLMDGTERTRRRATRQRTIADYCQIKQ
jgi:hypothetical protein